MIRTVDSKGRLWNKSMSRSARRKVAEISSHQDKKETVLKLTKVVKTSAKAYPIGAKQIARYWGIGLNKDNKKSQFRTEFAHSCI